MIAGLRWCVNCLCHVNFIYVYNCIIFIDLICVVSNLILMQQTLSDVRSFVYVKDIFDNFSKKHLLYLDELAKVCLFNFSSSLLIV
jgi:hypothetical protein